MNNIGHLITIKDVSIEKVMYLFLYITGEEAEDAYMKVIQGIRKLRLPKKIKETTEIKADPVTDLARFERENPEITTGELHKLPVLSFYDTRKKAFKSSLFLSGVKNIIEKKGAFSPSNRLPAVVTGSDFFDREDIIQKLWKQIEKGQNVLLCGPRRYGKTSIMFEIASEAAEHGFRPIVIDLESIFSPQEFLAKVQVEVEFPDWSEEEKFQKAVEIEDQLNQLWTDQGTRLFKKILGKKEKLVFILDECPYMLDSFLGKDTEDGRDVNEIDRENTNRFVKWFRKQRDLTKKHCVFLLAGSINLKPYLKDNSLNKDIFDDCKEVRVSLFDSKTVQNYIESLLLGQGIHISDEIIHELVRLATPGIPYFIQIVMNHVVSLYRENSQFSVEDLMKTYWEKIIGSEGRRLFDTFERHFKRYGRRKPGAVGILKELSKAGEKGLARRDIEKIYTVSSDLAGKSEFDIILRYLEYDFYIEKIKKTNRYRFSNPMLKDYWYKHQR